LQPGENKTPTEHNQGRASVSQRENSRKSTARIARESALGENVLKSVL